MTADFPSILAEIYANADEVAAKLGYPDPALRHEYHRHVTMLISQAYVQVFGTRVDAPDWVPHTGALFPWGAPNHDTLYRFAPVDARGTYRIGGIQGTEDIASVMLRRGGPNTGAIHGAPLGEIDVKVFETGPDRRFSFLLSPERPKDYDGLWFALHPDTTGIVTRNVTSTPEQSDGTWTLERLDRTPTAVILSPEDNLRQLRLLASFVTRFNEFLMSHVKGLRDRGLNRLFAEKYANYGGLADQPYFQGAFEFGPDEAILQESEIPERVHYWSVQLLDAFYSGIDMVPHQTALNGTQSHIDRGGRVRFIISKTDPGIANWLDTAGWSAGSVLWRWNKASAYPEPTLTRVKFSEIDALLPPETPRLDAAARREQRSLRLAQYQSRRRW